jgi:hypothetical protein
MDDKPDQYDEKESQARFEAALKGAMNTEPKPLKEKPKVRDKERAATKKPKR